MSVTRVTRAGNEDRKPYSYWAWDLAKLANNGITRRIGAIRNKPATPNENPREGNRPARKIRETVAIRVARLSSYAGDPQDS